MRQAVALPRPAASRADEPDEAAESRRRRERGKDAWDLQPRRIEAQGNPVVVTARSRGSRSAASGWTMTSRADRIVLDGSDVEPVFLRQGTTRSAPETCNTSPARRRPGPGRVDRPGRLVGQMDGRRARQFQATWGKQLQIRPVDGAAGDLAHRRRGGGLRRHGRTGGRRNPLLAVGVADPTRAEAATEQLRPDRMLATRQRHSSGRRSFRQGRRSRSGSSRPTSVPMPRPPMSGDVRRPTWTPASPGALPQPRYQSEPVG